ncbi:MAG TPA: ATP F0F1 synthase subunit B [Xanthobacteraceae bacterium]|nr:ATP F0F1 synthase subunit B [Xanthobacteraceae bacterium]
MFEAEFWVAVAFFVFVAFLGYVGAHRVILASLDQRRDKIKSELDEARRLRDEAEKLLAEYRRRQQGAESEARTIIGNAQAEAERIAEEAHARMQELIARRTAIAQTKIAQAEAQALADVRAAATDAAVAAAEQILRETAKGKVADDLIAKGIEDIKAKLH